MSKQETVVLLDQLADHPAVRAWRAIGGGPDPASVEVLKPEKRRSAVFRLNGSGPAGAGVIAKRRVRGELDLERRLYAEILPSLSVPTPQVLGFVETAEDQSWIFLEDAGELWYEPKAPEHRALAVRWLADLHTRSADFSGSMPDTGSAYFRSVLEAGLDSVRAGLAHSELSQGDRSILRSIAVQVELVGERWEDVEAVCAAAPRGVVHGDFVPKNVRVRPGRDGLEIVAFDWETAGVASPAADIGLLPEDGAALGDYHAQVREAWPELSWEDLQRLARIGRLLRLLSCVHWEARSFQHQWVEHSMRRMRAYERAFREVIDSSAWVVR
jgi:aminoglycoside phosphotransferase (APT) family kinase protein